MAAATASQSGCAKRFASLDRTRELIALGEDSTMQPQVRLIVAGLLFLASFAGNLSGDPPKAAPDPDEAVLTRHDQAVDDASLLRFLGQHSGPDADLKELPALMRQLADSSFREREQARAKVIGLGYAAIESLRLVQRDGKGEPAARARDCAQEIVKRQPAHVAEAVLRLLARKRPTGAVEAVLRYLPYTGGGDLEEEAWFTLDTLAARGGKLDAAFEKAIADGFAVRRAAAAFVLGRRGGETQRATAARLLQDPDPVARLRAAQGLLGAKDKRGIPALIALLDEPSVALAWQAEELLHWAAGGGAPEPTVGAGTAGERKKCREAWEGWWRREGDRLEVGRWPKGRRPVLALVCGRASVKMGERQSEVALYGCDGTIRWRLQTETELHDARLTTGDRVLLAEFTQYLPPHRKPLPGKGKPLRGVTERDLQGKVRWHHAEFEAPWTCEQLPSGDIYSGDIRRVTEITPTGAVVYLRDFLPRLPAGVLDDVEYPQRLPGGRFLYQLRKGTEQLVLVELGPLGHLIEKIEVREKLSHIGNRRGGLEVMPNGNYLLAGFRDGRVHEVNRAGEVVWQSPPLKSSQPGGAALGAAALHAVRLRGGNTLVAGSGRLLEIDAKGRPVWEAPASAIPERVRPCLGLVRLGFEGPGGSGPGLMGTRGPLR
jgi:hypothetical protein